MGVFKDDVEMMVFVTMADIDDRWTKDMSEQEKQRYYKEIIRKLQQRLQSKNPTTIQTEKQA